MTRRVRALVAAALLALSAAAEAQTTAPAATTRAVAWSGAPIPIYGVKDRTISITFPAAIAEIVTTATRDTLSIETKGSRLYLAPLVADYAGEIFVLLTNDEQVVLVLTPASGERPDLVVRVTSATAAAREATKDAAARWTPLRLMRAMLLNVSDGGVTVTAVSPAEVVYTDRVMTLRMRARWRTPALEGVVLEAENLTTAWIRLAVEAMQFPGLLAVHAERDTLGPVPTSPETRLAGRQLTRVYLVRTPE